MPWAAKKWKGKKKKALLMQCGYFVLTVKKRKYKVDLQIQFILMTNYKCVEVAGKKLLENNNKKK